MQRGPGSELDLKVLVFSDSHGLLDYMIAAVEREEPDCVLHLGDYWEDAQDLRAIYPEVPLTGVPGNCDWVADAPLERIITLEGCRIALCHGHTRGVKTGYRDLIDYGETVGADVVLCGHTHRPHYERRGPLHVLNPGSVGRGAPTCALLRLAEGEVIPDIISPLDGQSVL